MAVNDMAIYFKHDHESHLESSNRVVSFPDSFSFPGQIKVTVTFLYLVLVL